VPNKWRGVPLSRASVLCPVLVIGAACVGLLQLPFQLGRGRMCPLSSNRSFRSRFAAVAPALLLLAAIVAAFSASAHGVAGGDRSFLEQTTGRQVVPFIYLGAKHMITGYDHLLFLVGVIFFLYRLRDVAAYVTLFALGHSTTLLFGVLSGTHVNSYLVDAIIGFSVVYKAFDNIDAFQRWFGFRPNAKAAVLVFGFFHGFGLATKLQEFSLSAEGLIPNLVAFNVGVEIGQIIALSAILIAMNFWRSAKSFPRHAFAANILLMTAGLMLVGYQMTGYFVS
jgi:hypothetical protein